MTASAPSRSERVYSRILLAYPADFREEFGAEMEQLFRDCRGDAEGWGALARLWLRMLADVARGAARERVLSLLAGRRRTPPFPMEAPMIVAVFAVVVGIALGLGGLQEVYVVGIVGGQTQPFFIGLLGLATGALMVAAGVGIMRGWPQRRNLMMVAALLNVLFLVYAALPPHRNVGWNALIMGVVVSCVLAVRAYRPGAPLEAR